MDPPVARCAYAETTLDGITLRCRKLAKSDGLCKRHAAEKRSRDAVAEYNAEQERQRNAWGDDWDDDQEYPS